MSSHDPPRYIDGIRAALAEEMERDQDVILLGVDVAAAGGVYGATRGLHARFGGERVMDTPIAEAGVVGAAVGAAIAGYGGSIARAISSGSPAGGPGPARWP